jgi:hypothetical protein
MRKKTDIDKLLEEYVRANYPFSKLPMEELKERARRIFRATDLVEMMYEKVKAIDKWLWDERVARLAKEEARRKKISDGMKAAAKEHGYEYGGARRKSKLDRKKVHAMAAKGMSQAEIARKSGVTRARINQILKEKL